VALLGLGRLQRASGQAEALASLEHAAELDPENADALSELADARFERGLSGPARESYERLLCLRPQDAAAHNNLAVLLFRAGDVTGARRHVDAAAALGLAVHPDFLAALAQAER
jgi:Flp pilus assembly protein TadD